MPQNCSEHSAFIPGSSQVCLLLPGYMPALDLPDLPDLLRASPALRALRVLLDVFNNNYTEKTDLLSMRK